MIKTHQNFDKRLIARDAGYVHIVKVPWQKHQQDIWWNESCASVIEIFGLPGDRFTSHPRMDSMDFYFKSKKDADLCRILLSHQL